MAVTNFDEFEKRHLSGSTNGRGIKVVQTATSGTTIHTATSTASEFDEVWLWAVNSDTSAVKLTIEAGGTTSPDDLIEMTIAPEDGLVQVIPGIPYTGGVIIRAFAATANVIMIHGYINRMA